MGTGYMRVQVTTGDEALPVAGAVVIIKQRNGSALFKTKTDESGKTEDFPLPIYCFGREQGSNENPIYTICDIDVKAEGFVTRHIRGIEVFDTETTILPVHMEPLTDEENPVTDDIVEVSPNSQTYPHVCRIKASSPARSQNEVIIPDYITVHLGRPEDTSARNVRVSFPEYVKNTASSEIYATWPEESLRANIHAIVTFALNRVYT